MLSWRVLFPIYVPKRPPKRSRGEHFGCLFGAFWRVKAGIDFSVVFGALVRSSSKGRWPPSAVNSSKNRGRALSIQVRFLSDSGSILSSLLELF